MTHLTSLHLAGNRVHDMNRICLSDMMSLGKLDVSSNAFISVDPTPLWTMTFLETVDFRANPFHCSCDLLGFLQWINATHVTVAGLVDGLGYVCHTPLALAGTPLPHYRPEPKSCRATHNITKDLTYFAITVASVVGATMLLTLIIYYGNVCQHIKTLHYRWQIRYRTVSGIEIADGKV